jgi:flavin-binding protein dodecin
MTAQPEHVQAPGLIRVTELVGVSSKSWSDASRQSIERGSKEIPHITGVDVLHSTATVRDGRSWSITST